MSSVSQLGSSCRFKLASPSSDRRSEKSSLKAMWKYGGIGLEEIEVEEEYQMKKEEDEEVEKEEAEEKVEEKYHVEKEEDEDEEEQKEVEEIKDFICNRTA